MESPNKLWPLFFLGAAAAGWFGTGLQPLAWAAWLLPFFAFLATAGAPRRWRWLPATTALFLGGLNVWSYLSILPPLVRVVMLLIPAVVLGVCAGIFASFAARGKTVAGLFVPAAAWIVYEYAVSRFSPHGTFFSLAYTQADVLPIVQLASLGGLWLIDGVIFIVASGAALLLLRSAKASRRAILATLAVVVAISGVWAAYRLVGNESTGPRLTVGLLASDRAENMRFDGPGASEAIVERYLAESVALADRGAQTIVWPEHLVAFREAGADANAVAIETALQRFVATRNVALILGVDRRDASGVWWNEARIYQANTPVELYAKHRLLPGYESRYRPGTTWRDFTVRDQRLGVAICKDLDFTDTGRAYGQRNVGLLVVPAFDFTVDGWLHSRMALLRAVENGFALARTAKTGRLTVADAHGRILGETRSDSGAFAQLLVSCPVNASGTVYSRFGDWCALLAIGGCIFTAAAEARKLGFKRTRRPDVK